MTDDRRPLEEQTNDTSDPEEQASVPIEPETSSGPDFSFLRRPGTSSSTPPAEGEAASDSEDVEIPGGGSSPPRIPTTPLSVEAGSSEFDTTVATRQDPGEDETPDPREEHASEDGRDDSGPAEALPPLPTSTDAREPHDALDTSWSDGLESHDEAGAEDARIEEAEPSQRGMDSTDPVEVAEPPLRARRRLDPEEAASRLAQARELSQRASRDESEDLKRDFAAFVQEVEDHLQRGYKPIGLVGYSGSGKTHFLHALSRLLRDQGFTVEKWSEMRRTRVPSFTEAQPFYYPTHRGDDEKYVFIDAGGELYARLSLNDWELADDSAGLLHSLHHCQALFLFIHLQPEHFRLDLGTHRWMTDEDRSRDSRIQAAQDELDFFDQFLLFLRALVATEGDVASLAERCAEDDLESALREYRTSSERLRIPTQVLFTQADTLVDGPWEVGEAESLAPAQLHGVAPFVARRLRPLLSSMLEHVRRFRFDFVQSYEEEIVGADGEAVPHWQADDGELLSCGILPAFEYLLRHLPPANEKRSWLRALEIDARTSLTIDRILNRSQWGSARVPR